ncbi:MAG: hypothetical protein GAK34_03474 [Delftia tsuruhatensis]|nr:MAG: hypothetical protein GAK34_03474 [Delftia tsuruhatensis]
MAPSITWRGMLLTARCCSSGLVAAVAASSANCLAMPLLPWASMVSASPMPRRCATRPPAYPKPAVAVPVAAAAATWPGESSPSSVSWRICSAAEPAPTTPSPSAPAAAAPFAPAWPSRVAAPSARAATPPAPMAGSDSTTAPTMLDGFSTAALNLPPRPSASCNLRWASLVASECHSFMASRACFGRKPTAPPSFSRSLPARPPVTMSARPTAASGTATAPLATQAAASRA